MLTRGQELNNVGGTVQVENEPEFQGWIVGRYHVVAEQSGLDHIVDGQLKAVALVEHETDLVSVLEERRLDDRHPEAVRVQQRGVSELGQIAGGERDRILRRQAYSKASVPGRFL